MYMYLYTLYKLYTYTYMCASVCITKKTRGKENSVTVTCTYIIYMDFHLPEGFSLLQLRRLGFAQCIKSSFTRLV